MTKTRVLINGYGRVGRVLHRVILEDAQSPLEVVGINSRSDASSHAYLLKYDSTYGILDEDISCDGDYLLVNGSKIKVFQDKFPGDINFKEEGIDVIAECTGKFTDRESCEKQLQSGAKKVVISAPGKDEDISIVFGVNHLKYKPNEHHVISNASCTTNCLAPVMKVLLDNFGIQHGHMTTIHALTRSQSMLDGSHTKNMRLARAAIDSFIPSTTGASKAIGKVFPELDGKINAIAVRVPFSTVSMIDLVVRLNKATNTEKVNKVFTEASKNGLERILGVTNEPQVSIDFKGETRSAVVDMQCTSVVNGKMLKLFAWYDNEWGYCSRLNDLLKLVSAKLSK